MSLTLERLSVQRLTLEWLKPMTPTLVVSTLIVLILIGLIQNLQILIQRLLPVPISKKVILAEFLLIQMLLPGLLLNELKLIQRPAAMEAVDLPLRSLSRSQGNEIR